MQLKVRDHIAHESRAASKKKLLSNFLQRKLLSSFMTFGALGLVAAVDYQEPTARRFEVMKNSLSEKPPSHISFTAVTHEAFKLEKLDTSGLKLLDPNWELAVPSSIQGGKDDPNAPRRSK